MILFNDKNFKINNTWSRVEYDNYILIIESSCFINIISMTKLHKFVLLF